MSQHLAHVTLLVREYDEAIEFFVTALGFELVEDTRLSDEKRWVIVRPRGSSGASLILARGSTSEQRACVGNQSGGRVMLFLHTDDFLSPWQLLQHLPERGPAGATKCTQPLSSMNPVSRTESPTAHDHDPQPHRIALVERARARDTFTVMRPCVQCAYRSDPTASPRCPECGEKHLPAGWTVLLRESSPWF
ncbi:MAG: VOC family protein [Phycisphaerae bacterium]|nr:VOC family protein [Phycisphaerae bacterium]